MRGPLAMPKPGELSPPIARPQCDHRLQLEPRAPETRVPLADAHRSIPDQLHMTHAAKVQMLVPL